MDKGTIKTTRQARVWNPVLVQELSSKYGLSKYYIRQCLRKDRNNQTADTILKEYRRLERQLNKVFNENSIQ